MASWLLRSLKALVPWNVVPLGSLGTGGFGGLEALEALTPRTHLEAFAPPARAKTLQSACRTSPLEQKRFWAPESFRTSPLERKRCKVFFARARSSARRPAFGHPKAFARARSSENAAKCTRKLSHEPARAKTLQGAFRSSPLERQGFKWPWQFQVQGPMAPKHLASPFV